VCSPKLLDGAKIESPADILNLPLIGPHDPWWPQWFEEAGVGRVDLSDRLDNSLGNQQFEGMAAMAGQGVALVNPFFFAADLAEGRLVQIFDLVAKADRSYFVVYPKARRRSPKIRAFCDWILGEAERDSAQATLNEECRRTDRPFSFIGG
jgi:LysR family glycine cleavage system transcriptional activator